LEEMSFKQGALITIGGLILVGATARLIYLYWQAFA
jgi:hypothetical protein